MSAISTNVERLGPTFGSALFLTGLLLRFVVAAGMIALAMYQPLDMLILIAAMAADLSVFVWQLLRFNTASNIFLTHTGRFWPVAGGYGGFLIAALCMMFIWFSLFSEADKSSFKQFSSNSEEVAKPKIDRFKTNLSRDGSTMAFTGVMAQGMMRKLEAQLNDPNLRQITLDSPGGNIYEARDLARKVRDKGLSTYVAKECSASCLLVFTAGNTRNLGPGAELGFHRYGLDFTQVLPHVSPLKEMPIDRRYLQSRGLNTGFLGEYFDLDRPALWYPSRSELFRAGVISSR